MLSEEQIRMYQDQGYLVVPSVLTDDELGRLKESTDHLINASRAVSGQTDVYDVGPDHTPSTPQVRRIKHPDRVDAAFDNTLRHDRILDIIASLMGPGIRYQQTKLNVKAAKTGEAVEWHQDWAYIPHTNDDLLAVGIPLDDMTRENGCLQVVPGSHRMEVFDHHSEGVFVGAVDIEPLAELMDSAVPVEVPAGGLSIHHTRTLHGSAPNPSDRSRRLFLLELGANDAWPILGVEDFHEFNSRIIRGEPTVEPRLESVPVRLPLPRKTASSIYEVQEGVKKSAFA